MQVLKIGNLPYMESVHKGNLRMCTEYVKKLPAFKVNPEWHSTFSLCTVPYYTFKIFFKKSPYIPDLEGLCHG